MSTVKATLLSVLRNQWKMYSLLFLFSAVLTFFAISLAVGASSFPSLPWIAIGSMFFGAFYTLELARKQLDARRSRWRRHKEFRVLATSNFFFNAKLVLRNFFVYSVSFLAFYALL